MFSPFIQKKSKIDCSCFRANLHQIFIDMLHFNEVTVDVVEVEAARKSLVIGSVWGMARERMQDNDDEKLQNTGEDDNRRRSNPGIYTVCFIIVVMSDLLST